MFACARQGPSRRWCFTLNNPAAGDHEGYLALAEEGGPASYIVLQLEVGESGTPHLQGHIVMRGATRFGAMRRLMPRAHLEKARGSVASNEAYCTKEEGRQDGPWRAGTAPKVGVTFSFARVHVPYGGYRPTVREDYLGP